MNRLLVEIGTEEIPAGYIGPALAAFSSILGKRLNEARIPHGLVHTYGTPRRLAVLAEDVADKQTALTTEIMGPPERAGIAENGEFTQAARKFAEKNGVSVDGLKVKETDKGRYLYATKTDRGLLTRNVLKGLLPEVILSIPFPKTMRWAGFSIAFARPIHSLCALLGKQPIVFQVGDVKSGRYTFGHRFMSPQKIRLDGPERYLAQLAHAKVLADTRQRKQLLETRLREAADQVGGYILADDELVDTVLNLIEYPEPVVGQFDRAFLELPREILITAMREHQKYFAVVEENGRLTPYFVAVNNTRAQDMKLVAKGHERVLRARLSDARFFVETDMKIPLDQQVEKLKTLLFQAKLGTVFDKTLRVQNLTAWVSAAAGLSPDADRHSRRAAWLCKADLVSHAVIEFPNLQGVMGRVYALRQQEPEPVALAIEAHYRPISAGAPLPDTLEGAVVGVADKMDSICGCFSAGLIPTGAADPYALRRQANGILLIILKHRFGFSLNALIGESLALFGPLEPKEAENLKVKILEFFKGRMAHLLEDEGVSRDAVAAVLAVPMDTVGGVWERAKGLQALKSAPDFTVLATAFKRVVNIIRKADPTETRGGEVSPEWFEHGAEGALLENFETVREKVLADIQNGRIGEAFSAVASMREAVDRFFDDVMVMCEDKRVRQNRLALLGRIAGLFELLADFSKISA